MGAAMHATLVVVGDKLGLSERYVREWLNANAASGYVTYDPDT